MLDHPWLRVVLGVLAAAALGALAARVALSVPGTPAAGGTGGGGPGGSGSRTGAAPAARSGGTGADASGAGSTAAGAVRVEGGSDALVVHVVGAVRRPGVYTLRPGQRIKDAVHRAGGATRHADPQGLNLAAPVRDGQQIVMPRRAPRGAAGSATAGADAGGGSTTGSGDAGPGAATSAGGSAPAAIDLNTASAEQLQTLDGVGPTTAQKIVALRQERGGLRGVDDLDEVPGIGPKKLEAIRAQLGG